MRTGFIRARRMQLLTCVAPVFLFISTVDGAYAQSANTTPANVNVLTLLSPFLNLNATTVGQSTLSTNLSQAIAINTGATPALQSLSISDKNLLGSASNTVTGAAGTYGVAANLAGGLPTQTPINGITPMQPVGGFGAQLGAIYDTGVNGYAAGTSTSLANTVSLLAKAYSYTSSDLGIAKNYFANGTTNGTITAVAPSGFTLPTANGLPNRANSVYDLAYGVTNTQANQNIYGDSRPLQVAGSQMNQFDPTALAGINTNPSFPSGHTTYAYTDSILLGMLVPQEYQSMLSRAAEYANSRIVLGVHYPLDIIASRSLASYDLAQAFTNSTYMSNAATTGTAINLPSLFTAANTELNGYLSAQCGASIATCAASTANTTNDPYVVSSANLAAYTASLTYGLPTLTFVQAPREAAPTGGPDASILLATIYGGDTTAAKTLAPNGGIYGSLQTNTINQIVVNTETNALAAFYGTSLSYWSRINLYAASSYFQNTSGVLTLATTDNVTVPVTVGSTGVLIDNGTITGATTVAQGGVLGGTGLIVGNTTVQAGGMLAPGGYTTAGIASTPGKLTVTGNLTFNSGSTYGVQIGSTASTTKVSGTATLGGAGVSATFGTGATIATKYTILSAASISGTFGAVTNTNFTGLSDTVTYDAQNAYLLLAFAPSSTGATGNQRAISSGINTYFQTAGSLPVSYAALSGTSLSQASGEAATGSHEAAFGASDAFMSALAGGLSNPGAPDVRGAAGMISYYADPKPKIQKTAAAEAIEQQVFKPYWTAWAQTFGGTEHIGGSAATGSSSTDTQNLGEMIGAEYRLARDTSLGFAVGGGGQWFSLANGMGSGKAGFGQFGVFGTHSFDTVYVTGALGLGFDSVTTDRTVVGPTTNGLHGSYTATVLSARGEIGDKIKTEFATITPYAALQETSLFLPSYTETSSTGAGSLYALHFDSKTANDTKSELGLRFSQTLPINGQTIVQTVTLQSRIAWQYDFNPRQTAQATFVDLPGSTFTVAGARPAPNVALLNTGAKFNIGNGLSLEAGFDGAFASNVQVYAGHGRLTYNW